MLSWSQALRLLEPTSTVQSSRRERPQSSLSRQSGKFLGILCLVQQKGRKCADLQANVVFLMHRLAREVHLRAESLSPFSASKVATSSSMAFEKSSLEWCVSTSVIQGIHANFFAWKKKCLRHASPAA